MPKCNRTNHTTIPTPGKADAEPATHRTAWELEFVDRSEIAVRCLKAATACERRRWQVVGMLADQAPPAEIAAATGYRLRTIRDIARRYRESGAAALADRRAQSRGAPRLLSPEQERKLWRVLQGPAPDGGAWSGPKVARWIAASTGRRVHRQRGWEYLRQLQGAAAPAIPSQLAAQASADDVQGCA